ncbi:hypothetical protein DXA24_11775, partial [Bacteroides sp. CF01-10NS]
VYGFKIVIFVQERRYIMTATKKIKTREELRVEVVKKITANKRNAQSFLKKAGIVSKSGELTKIYR